jgi:uncharacterized protein (TIGR03086 family)
MNAGDLNDLAVLTEISSEFARMCASIRDEQWSLPTPCTEWDLSQLVDHVTGGNRFTILVLNGEPAEAAMAETVKSFDKDHEPRTAALESIETQRVAFGEPGVLDRVCDHVVGELTGRVVLGIRLHELIIHTWDIAEALEPPASIRDEFVAWSFAEIAGSGSRTVERFALDAAALGGRQSQQSLLAAFGRRSTAPRGTTS